MTVIDLSINKLNILGTNFEFQTYI